MKNPAWVLVEGEEKKRVSHSVVTAVTLGLLVGGEWNKINPPLSAKSLTSPLLG